MKKLGRIEIGGSLDITHNKHVEDLIEEAIQGIEIPEDTNTTYTLTQDGTIIRLEGSDGGTSEIDLAPLIPPPVDPYQVERGILTTVNLYDTIGRIDPYDFDITSELDEETNRVDIYLHLYRSGILRKFRVANIGSEQQWQRYDRNGRSQGSINFLEVYKDGANVHMVGADRTVILGVARIELTANTALSRAGGVAIVGRYMIGDSYFVLPVSGETESEPLVITATLEEHLQNVY